MRLPKTSGPGGSPKRRYFIGRGDFVAGGVHTHPFLALDGAIRQRPIVFGEVWSDVTGYPEVAAQMFSGCQNNPYDWALMWRDLGADGIFLRLGDDAGEAACIVKDVSDSTLMPLAVSVPWNHVEVYSTIAEAVKDTVITFVCPDARVAREVERYCYGHVVSVPAGERVGVVSKMCGNVMIHSECVFREDMGDQLSGLCGIHAAGISGDPDSDCPLICDVTGTWDVYGGDAAQTSILEGESVLNAMLCGADVLFVRSPAAADMARFYGEELSGL